MVHYGINNLKLSVIISKVPSLLCCFFFNIYMIIVILFGYNFVFWDQYPSYIFKASGTNQNTVKLKENGYISIT